MPYGPKWGLNINQCGFDGHRGHSPELHCITNFSIFIHRKSRWLECVLAVSFLSYRFCCILSHLIPLHSMYQPFPQNIDTPTQYWMAISERAAFNYRSHTLEPRVHNWLSDFYVPLCHSASPVGLAEEGDTVHISARLTPWHCLPAKGGAEARIEGDKPAWP